MQKGKYDFTVRVMDDDICDSLTDTSINDNNKNNFDFIKLEDVSDHELKCQMKINGKWTTENSFGPERIIINKFQK